MDELFRENAARVFREVLSVDPSERTQRLNELAGEDDTLRDYVRQLLRADEISGDFLEPHEMSTDPDLQMHDTTQLDGGDPFIGKRFGDYQLMKLIGQGGMGRVYQAERIRGGFRQTVAVKILFSDFLSSEARVRFEIERQTLSSLRHPNLVTLLDGGEFVQGESQTPYFAMEYVTGMTLGQYCDTNELTIEQRLKLFLDVCHGISYCHQRGVIHRDLKPSNILVSDEGRVRILDFGIAKSLDPTLVPDQVLETGPGGGPFTPAYASPEQARGDSLTTKSDIYSLGIVLYELLTGCRPYNFETKTPAEIRRVIEEVQPPAPAQRFLEPTQDSHAHRATARSSTSVALRRRLQGDLDTIVMTAIDKTPERRYESVSRFAADIQAHLDHRPITARPISTLGQLHKWARRSPMLATTTSLIILLALSLVLTIVFDYQQLSAAFSSEQASAQRARKAFQAKAKAEKRTEEKLYQNTIRLVHESLQSGDAAMATERLRSIPARFGSGRDLRGFEFYHLRKLVENPGDWHASAHRGAVLAMVSRRRDHQLITCGADGRIATWNSRSGKLLSQLTLQRPVKPARRARFSSDGTRLVIAGTAGQLTMFDVATGQTLWSRSSQVDTGRKPKNSGTVDSSATAWDANHVAFSSDDSTVAVLFGRNHVETWNTRSGKRTGQFDYEFTILTATPNHNGSLIYAAGKPGLDIRDAGTGNLVRSQTAPDYSAVHLLVESPDRRHVLAGVSSGNILVYDLQQQTHAVRTGHKRPISTACFSQTTDRVVTGARNGIVRLWSLQSAEQDKEFRGLRSAATCVTVTHDESWIVAGSEDGQLIGWSISKGSDYSSSLEAAWAVAAADDQQVVVAGGDLSTSVTPRTQPSLTPGAVDRGELLQLDLASGQLRSFLQGKGSFSFLLPYPEGNQLAVAVSSTHGPGKVVAMDLTTGAVRNLLLDRIGSTHCLAFTPDGKYLLAGRAEPIPAPGRSPDRSPGRLFLINPKIGSPHAVLDGFTHPISDLSVSPNGKHVVLALSGGGKVPIVSLHPTDARLQLARQVPLKVNRWGASVARFLDDKACCVATFDPRSPFQCTAEIIKLNLADGSSETKVLKGHSAAVVALEKYSGKGSLVSASFDGTIRFWDVQQLRELRRINLRAPIFGLKLDRSHKHAFVATLVAGPDPQFMFSKIRLADGQHEKAFAPVTRVATAMTLDRQGKTLFTGDLFNGSLLAWDSNSGETRVLPGSRSEKAIVHQGTILSTAATSRTGGLLATGGADQQVILWSTDGKVLDQQKRHRSRVGKVAFGPNGKWLISASGNDRTGLHSQAGELILWNIEERKLRFVRELQTAETGLLSLAISPNGSSVVASEGRGNAVLLWNLATGEQVGRFVDAATPIVQLTDLSFSPDGNSVVSVGQDKAVSGQSAYSIRLWDVASGAVVWRSPGHKELPTCVAYAPDGRTIASGSLDSDVLLWQAQTGEPLMRLNSPLSRVLGLCFTRNGKHLIASGLGVGLGPTIHQWNSVLSN